MHQPRHDGHLPGNYCIGFAAFDERGDFSSGDIRCHDEGHAVRVVRSHRGDDITRADGDYRDAGSPQFNPQAFQITDCCGF